MGKTKGLQVVTVFFVLFLVGGFVWFSLIRTQPKSLTWSGTKYGGRFDPIVIEFQAESIFDYWKLSYRTSEYFFNEEYEVTVYQLDRCSFDLYQQGFTPDYDNVISEDQVTTLTLRPNFAASGKNDNAVYIVWNIHDGRVKVELDSNEVFFLTVKGLYGYMFGGLALFGFFYTFVLYKSKHPNKFPRKYTKLEKKYSQRFNKRNFCALCGIEMPNNAEFCLYCGNIYTAPNLDEIKTNNGRGAE